MADSRSGVQGSLLQLQEFLSTADRCSAAVASHQLIRGLGQECVLSTSPAVLGGYPTRSVALRLRGGVWRFRADECARVSVQRFSKCFEVQILDFGSSQFLWLCIKSDLSYCFFFLKKNTRGQIL